MTPRLLLLFAAFPVTLVAQVGTRPEASPFRDVSIGTRVATYAGWYSGASDPAGVLPKSGPLLGFRWDVHVGGPADLSFRLTHVWTTRDVIDPTKVKSQRLVDTRNVSLGFADLGIVFHLTGNKSWHSLMPLLYGSVGIVSDFAGADVGGYQHGSTFALGYGLGVRYAPRTGRLGMRLDAGSYYYSQQYPTSYYTPASDGTSVLTSATPTSQWHSNFAISLGVNYALFK